MIARLKDWILFRGVRRRISFLFLIAAFLPVITLTIMLYGMVAEISHEQDEQKKVETSRAYSIKVYERILFAEAAIQRLSSNPEATWKARDLLFNTVALVAPNGRMLQHTGEPLPASVNEAISLARKSASYPHKAAVHVLKKMDAHAAPAIAISMNRPIPGHPDAILFAVFNPMYLWGDPEAESQEFNTCVYGVDKTQLFCVYSEGSQKDVEQAVAKGAGIWELFLKGRFHGSNWVVATQHRYAAQPTQWQRFFSIYVKVALLSVFLVGFLSLFQIRRTMGPLRKLIDGTRRIAHGDYAPVEIPANNEFRELATAINDMSGRISEQIRTLQEHEERFRHQARFDSLTSLTNRRALFAMLDVLGEDQYVSDLTGVLLLDIDRFKFFNNTLGHRAGDFLLRQIARRLEHLVDDNDTVARLSGDEFVIVLRDCKDREEIRQIVERIIMGMGEPFNVEGNDYALTCSIGVAVFPEDANNPEMIVEAADMAMYESKKKGRNNFQFFIPTMRDSKLNRLRLDTDVRHALERNEFFLEYQPKVNASTGRIVGAEALIRWAYPKLGVVSPDNFIPLIEDIGLMVPIGAWVLETACAQNMAWHQAGFTDMRVAVNISAYQLAHHSLVPTVERVLQETGLPARCLELELTESAIMENFGQGIETIAKLRSLGVHLSLDDFGTGYSSLYYLKHFPVHFVKIDRAFISDLTTKDEDAVIVRSIISLAHDLQLQVVAEGVETIMQRDLLLASGCDEFQGFLFARPVVGDEVKRLLERQKRDA
ncbi:MAG: sensor domain-containing phosphodiesterase [Oxalobacter sp.]|nr:MAG: sensor domain-containing phosphodiesterase [Oxalobacter sp.]